MSTQAVAKVNPSIAMVFENPTAWATLKDVAIVMFSGGGGLGVLPSCFKNPQQVQAGMLVLMGMGEDPVGGLQHVHPLPGNKIGFDYKFLMGLVEARAPQWMFGVEEEDDQHIKGWFQASEKHPRYNLTYHIDEAKTAGLLKPSSAWDKHPRDMIFKSWWLRGARRTAPAAMRGIGIQHDVEMDDDAPIEVTPPAQTMGEKVDVALAKPKSEARVVDEVAGAAAPIGGNGGAAGAPAPAAPAEPVDYQEKFVGLMKLAKMFANKKGKEARNEHIRLTLVAMLTEQGVVPTIKSAADVPMADWRLAYTRLAERYSPETGAYCGRPGHELNVGEGAGGGGGTTPTPARTDSAPAPDAPPADEPPPSDEPPGDPDGEAARDSQLADPEYLKSIAQSLELAWKQPETVVKESPAKSGKWWFRNADLLLACGFRKDDGACQQKALYVTSNQAWNLEPHEVRALSLAVLSELDRVANRGRPVAAQRS